MDQMLLGLTSIRNLWTQIVGYCSLLPLRLFSMPKYFARARRTVVIGVLTCNIINIW